MVSAVAVDTVAPVRPRALTVWGGLSASRQAITVLQTLLRGDADESYTSPLWRGGERDLLLQGKRGGGRGCCCACTLQGGIGGRIEATAASGVSSGGS